MLNKLIKEAFITIIGKQFSDISDLLDTQKFVNEFLIAKKLDITINQVRNLLYKLADYGLVSSIRKKDKKKGWYTYFWKIETLRTLDFLKKILVSRIDQLSNQIRSRKTKDFYICERCNIELNEENALLYDFTCNECGGIFSLKDNSKLLKEMDKTIDRLKRKLKIIELEINKENEKTERKKLKELKKEEKERAKKKAQKKIARDKVKQKKQKTKKLIKKKVSKKNQTKKTRKIKKKYLKKKPQKIKKSNKKSKK